MCHFLHVQVMPFGHITSLVTFYFCLLLIQELEGDEEGEEEDDAEVNPKKEPSQPAECKQQ